MNHVTKAFDTCKVVALGGNIGNPMQACDEYKCKLGLRACVQAWGTCRTRIKRIEESVEQVMGASTSQKDRETTSVISREEHVWKPKSVARLALRAKKKQKKMLRRVSHLKDNRITQISQQEAQAPKDLPRLNRPQRRLESALEEDARRRQFLKQADEETVDNKTAEKPTVKCFGEGPTILVEV